MGGGRQKRGGGRDLEERRERERELQSRCRINKQTDKRKRWEKRIKYE